MWFGKDRASAEASLRASAKRLRSGVIWEGLGLLGMRERVQLLDGSLAIETAPGSGTTLAVELPLP